jgi:type IV pilus modification protein PilV
MKPAALRRPARGFGLIEALIAIAVLAFGMVTLVQFQGRLVSQTTETQSRQTANQFAGELLGTVLVDAPNAACYTLPQDGTCANNAAKDRTSAWADRVEAALPDGTASSTLDAATGRLTVAITWTGKASQDTRRLESTTDVR